MDFHSQKDQDIIVWVTRSLAVENWTAIREIGVLYDAALVETTDRATPQSAANADTFSIWSVSLTNHLVVPLIRGVNLRWLDWMRFRSNGPEELAVLYDNCRQCLANTYFTAFYYDPVQHGWAARWMRGGQGGAGVELQRARQHGLDAGLRGVRPAGRAGDARHLEPLRLRTAETPRRFCLRIRCGSLQRLGPGATADRDRRRLHEDAHLRRFGRGAGLARGQDTPLCIPYVRRETPRKPATTPADNHGQAFPHGSRPRH